MSIGDHTRMWHAEKNEQRSIIRSSNDGRPSSSRKTYCISQEKKIDGKEFLGRAVEGKR